MKYLPNNLHTRNGEPVTIRMAEEADAAALIATIKAYAADSPYVPLSPEEFVNTEAEEQQLITRFVAQENSLFLVAVHEGRIVGNIDVAGSQRSVMRHTAMIGMGMLQAYRGKGLGTLLLQEVIAWAVANPVLELLWLEVYAENEAGLQLYRNCGFEERGYCPGFFKDNGVYADKIMMSRCVSVPDKK